MVLEGFSELPCLGFPLCKESCKVMQAGLQVISWLKYIHWRISIRSVGVALARLLNERVRSQAG